ncbi:MAG TPA: 2-hydroxyacid dehydrogenase [Roseiarcus sp.]|nr:2-hydroxyacid dehydrogenase [Roseiarcus sp.]
MKSLDVLMPAKGMQLIEDEIGARLKLHRLWLEPNPDLWLAEWATKIGALAMTGGHAPLDEAYLRRYPNLEIVSSFGVGYDNIDAKAAARLGIIVTNTPGVLDEEVADTALGLMIMTVRQLPQAERHLRAGLWPTKGAYPLSPSLRGRTVGILGLGRIGKAIARRVSAFGLDVVYHGRNAQADVPYRYYPSLIAMAKASDVLIVVAPGGGATRHIVDAEVLKALGPDGVLINIARGSLVDEKALIEALRNKTILAAGLDVFENEPSVPQELIALENAVLLPHVGSASVRTRRAMAECVVSNVFAWADGKAPLTPVPETPWQGRWMKRSAP